MPINNDGLTVLMDDDEQVDDGIIDNNGLRVLIDNANGGGVQIILDNGLVVLMDDPDGEINFTGFGALSLNPIPATTEFFFK